MASLEEMKIAAYNMTELPGLIPEEQNLYNGLAYCYEWYRAHPEDREECMERAEKYIDWFNRARMREVRGR